MTAQKKPAKAKGRGKTGAKATAKTPTTRAREEGEPAAVWVDRTSLVPWADNPRNNSATVARVADSIKRFGFASPIIARAADREVIAGHTRLLAAEVLGLERVPVRFLDLDPADAHLLALADNRLQEFSAWDAAGLGGILAELSREDAALAGWSPEDVNGLADDLLGELRDAEIEETPNIEPPADPVTELGDIWTLGNHTLVCGDCTDPEVYGGRKFSLGLTDPPYGVGLAYDQHEDTEAALRTLAAGFFAAVRPIVTALVFSPGITRQWFYPEPDWVLCWFYGGGQLRSSWGFNCWQPFLAYGPDPSLASGRGARPDSVNMNTPANAADIAHPCPKPTKLWEWMLKRLVFRASDTVLDPFAGSGTTLLCCEQLGLESFSVEISPAYCDVIVSRWESLTGKNATRAKRCQ